MVKVFVIYDSKYGNTKLVSEKILEGINDFGVSETSISYVKEIDVEKMVNYNVFVLGASNHMGMPSRIMTKFVDELAELNLKTGDVAVFGTYAGKERLVDRAVKKLEKRVKAKLPKLKVISPGLSVRVNGVTGPIAEGELPKCIAFGKKIADQIRNK